MNTSKRFLITAMAVGSIVLLGQQPKVQAQSNDPASTNAAGPVETITAAAPVEMKRQRDCEDHSVREDGDGN